MMKVRSLVVFGLVVACSQVAMGQVGNDAPIGSILGWHKSYTNTPVLPTEWVECNGQVLNLPGSPYHGQTLPNLNGEARFLRGSSLSGTSQAATEVAVLVESNGSGIFYNDNGVNVSAHNNNFDLVTTTTTTRGFIANSSSDAGAGQISSGQVRASNMSVVWIMRVAEATSGNAPAVGTWGLIVLMAMLVIGGTIVLRERRAIA